MWSRTSCPQLAQPTRLWLPSAAMKRSSACAAVAHQSEPTNQTKPQTPIKIVLQDTFGSAAGLCSRTFQFNLRGMFAPFPPSDPVKRFLKTPPRYIRAMGDDPNCREPYAPNVFSLGLPRVWCSTFARKEEDCDACKMIKQRLTLKANLPLRDALQQLAAFLNVKPHDYAAQGHCVPIWWCF